MRDELVLCVDDDQLYLRMLSSYLEACGYPVVAETSGRAALQSATDRKLHAAVLDCFLPDMSAGELALELNRLQPATPIIILTGSRNAVPARVSALADAVLSKETGIEYLVSALERAAAMPHPKAIRKYPRYQVQMSVLLQLVRSNVALRVRGTTTTLAEGGLGAVLDGELYPGEDVSVEFLGSELQSVRAQAQVRYREGDTYGFEFLALGASDRSVLRDVLSTN